MKSNYVKPQLRIEHFSLSQSVAQSCGWSVNSSYGTPGHDDPYTCAWVDLGGDNIFIEQTSACVEIADIGDSVGEGCYNAPSGIASLFAS